MDIWDARFKLVYGACKAFLFCRGIMYRVKILRAFIGHSGAFLTLKF